MLVFERKSFGVRGLADGFRMLLAVLGACLVFGLIGGCAGGGTRGTSDLRVTGLVVDQNRAALANALVTDLNSGAQTTTDEQGQFTIDVEDSDQGPAIAFTKDAVSAPLELPELENASAGTVLVEFDSERAQATALEVVVTSRPSIPTPKPVPTSTPITAPTQQATPTALTVTSTPTTQPTTAPGATESPTPAPSTPTPPVTPSPTATPAPQFALGDLNCDGVVSVGDVGPFTTAITDPQDYETQFPNCDRMLADINQDGNVDFFDIDPFVALIQ